MSDFSNYSDNEKQRRGILLGAAAGIGAAFALPAVRAGAAKILLGGVASLGRQFGRGMASLRIQNTATELKGLLEQGLPRMAQASLATERATEGLLKVMSRSGAENAAIHARELATSTAFQRFLNTGMKRHLEQAMAGSEVRGIIGRHVAEIGRVTPADAIGSLLSSQTSVIRDALSNVARPSFAEAALHTTTARAGREISRLAGEHLEGLGQRGLFDRVIGWFGVEKATLGDVAHLPIGAELSSTRQFLMQHASEDVVNKAAIGGMLKVGGEIMDFRPAIGATQRLGNWLSSNFQIPLAPGMAGISPGQLFPWAKGKLPQEFAVAAQFGRDPIGRALLGSETGRLGQDVVKVGRKFLAVDFANNAVNALNIDADLRSGLYGFAKRRSMAVNSAIGARAAGGNGLFQFFNRNWRHSELGERLSVITKFRDPNWMPNVLDRLQSGDINSIVGEDIERLGHFLTTNDLPSHLQKAVVEHAKATNLSVFKDDVLGRLAGNIHDDEAVFGFFNRILENTDVIDTFKSGRLKSMARKFRSSPNATLAMLQPSVDRDAITAGIFGIKGDRRGIDLMRGAVVDEFEEAIRRGSETGTGFLDWAAGAKLDGRDLTTVSAYGHGKRLLSDLNKDQGLIRSVNYIRDNEGVRRDISAFTRTNVKAWDVFRAPDAETLNTAELIVPRGQSIVRQMVETINKYRTEGGNPLNAIVDVIKSPAAKQYSAFFTGNQADVTATTLWMEHLPRRLEQYFQTAGLGLPERDLLSGGSILSNLMLKRILPVVAAYEGYRYADYKLHQAGLQGPSDIYANLRSRAGIARASLTGGNLLGIGRRELFPGLDRVLPNRTVEEEVEHQKSGYEPVRKGRFWLLGSRTPLFGDKVSYFLPSAVSVARSRWQEAENADLNTKDYWAHSFMPLPENNFLGPLNWLRDRYWYENKHSAGPNADRPYIVSGELSDPNSAHGPFVNATIGRLIKPQRVLHPEFLPENLGGSSSRAQLKAINEAQKDGLDIRGAGLLVGGGGGAGGGFGGGGLGLASPGVIAGGGLAPIDQGSIAEITAGGQLAPISPPAGTGEGFWSGLGKSTLQGRGGAKRLSRREIENINRMTKAGVGGLTKVRPSSVTRLMTQTTPFSDEDMDLINYRSGGIQMASNISELAGLYGFMFRTGAQAVGLPIEQRGKVIATPSRAYGFSRRLHELGLGSFGEGVTEVFRRFSNRPEVEDSYNPVPNMMPAWMPGPEYFIDFRHGDPYTKVQRGELRLPGEAYERTHHVKMLQTRASSIGKSIPDIMRGMLYLEQPMSESGEEATEVGTEMHRVLQRRWKRMGILIGAEQSLQNEELGISGHYDAVLAMQEGKTLVDIKTVNQKRFEEAQRHPFAEHMSQVNYYLHETGINRGAIVYVNRDQPWQTQSHFFGFSQGRFNADVGKVKEARSRLLGMVDKGLLSRGDLYDPTSRFEILGDVAPYSDNYTQLREYLQSQNAEGQLSPEDNKRFQAAKKRVALQKKTVEVTPYRFSNMDLDYQTVTVDKILDPNTVMIRGSDHPLRLAGGRSSQSRIEEIYGPAPEGMSPAEWQFHQFGIHPGSRMRVALEGDPERKISDDVLKTQHAVLFSHGVNVNKALIEQGVATEKDTDYSSTGVAARFTDKEIRIGRIWETIAHSDNPITNKLLHVRSPLEELERGIVFGKNTGGWSAPIRDWLSPTVTSFMSRDNPLWAAAGMGGVAAMFMRTKQARLWAGIGGAVVGAGLSIGRQLWEGSSGEVWKPERTKRREELEQYWDILKYVKYRGLAAQEDELAKQEEGTDMESLTRGVFEEGQKRARKKNWLEERKRQLILDDREENQSEISKIQDQLDQVSESQGMLKLGPHATRALQYRDLYRSTLYGIEPGTTPFLNMFRAFPKYKRELIQGFIEKSNEEERKRIYELLPEQEQRAIGQYLGIDKEDIPDRPILGQFFREHPLPGPNWAGWAADVDLESMREIAIKSERLDPQESGINNMQIEEAEREIGNVPIPTLRGSTASIQKRLNEVLSGRGLKNVRVQVDVSPHDGDRDEVNVQMNIRKRREQEIMNALQKG